MDGAQKNDATQGTPRRQEQPSPPGFVLLASERARMGLLTLVIKTPTWSAPFGSTYTKKNPPSNARDTGSISDLGRPHMPQGN